jgi:tRNA (guanine37-N1)-methyltransferase
VPEVLLSGDHARIAKWRRQQSLLRTLQRRPDLLEKATLTDDDVNFLSAHGQERSV